MSEFVYITKIAKFLPGPPVSNDEMEEYLGVIGGKKSRSKSIVLRNNGIKNRHYALNKKSEPTHTNAAIAAESVKKLSEAGIKQDAIELMCCGTTTPDQVVPSHGVMVHGHLPEMKNSQVVSFHAVCCSGMHAFKYGYFSIKAGETKNAVISASERTSSVLKHQNFEEENKKLEDMESNPIIAFEKEFLRWMLSDGSAAVLLEDKPNANGLSLKVEWIDTFSYANEAELCMYLGGEKYDGTFKPWADHPVEDILGKSLFAFKQDVKLLDKHVVSYGTKSFVKSLTKHNLKPEEIDHFLPHISSMYFADKVYNSFVEAGVEVKKDKWFLNLTEVGNVGAASIFLALEGLMGSGKLQKGQKVFLCVPESARFSYAYALLTVC